MKKHKNEISLFKVEGALRDGVIALVAVSAAFAVALSFDLSGAWHELAETYRQYHLDEVPVFMVILAVMLVWFSLRRWRESRLTSTVRRRLNAHMEVLLSREAMRTRQLAEIKAMDENMLVAKNSRQGCEMAITHLRRIFGFGSGIFFVARQGPEHLTAIGGWGTFANMAPEGIEPCRCLALVPNVYHGERRRIGKSTACGDCPLAEADGVLCMPVTGHEKTFGVLQIAYGGSYGKLPPALKNRLAFEEMSRLIGEVCRSIGRHLENIGLRSQLCDEAWRDPLTGLLNRRGLEQVSNEEMARISQGGEHLAVMMMDVDEFKGINDTFGHEVGDSVLEFVGQTIQEQCRGGDITCRLGGDEFLIALPAASIDIARAKGEAIRSTVANLQPLRQRFPALNVTLSVGLAVYPDDGVDWNGLAAAADEALYTAKRRGRNQVAAKSDPPLH